MPIDPLQQDGDENNTQNPSTTSQVGGASSGISSGNPSPATSGSGQISGASSGISVGAPSSSGSGQISGASSSTGQAASGSSSGAPTVGGASSSSSPSTGSSQNNVTSQGATTSIGNNPVPESRLGSGSFTNLNQYVNANADQSQGLGQQIGQSVESSANKGLSQLNQSQQQFNAQEQAAGVNPNTYSTSNVQSLANNIINNPGSVQSSQLTGLTQAQSQANALQNGTDTAPKALTDLSGYQTANSSLQNAENNATLAGTESGRSTLLNQIYQNPNYTTGQNSLDQLLTQNVPQNSTVLQNLSNNLLGQYGLANQETQAVQNAAAERQNVVQSSEQANNNINNVLYGQTTDANGNVIPGSASSTNTTSATAPGVLTNYLNQLANQPTNFSAQQTAEQQSAIQALSTYIQNNGLNTSVDANGNVTRVDPTQMATSFITPSTPAANVNLQNTLTAPEVQSLQEISQLQNSPTVNVGTQALNTSGLTAGNLTANPTVNSSGLLAQVKQNMNTFGNQVSTNLKNGLNSSVTAYGNTTSLNQAAQNAVNRVNIRMEDPQYDTAQTGIVVNALQGQLNSLNNIRQQAGLPPVDQNALNQSISNYQQQVMQSILPKGSSEGGGGLGSVQGGTAAGAVYEYLYNPSYYAQDTWAQAVMSAVNNSATIQALNSTLNQYQANPLTGSNDNNVDAGYITNLVNQAANQAAAGTPYVNAQGQSDITPGSVDLGGNATTLVNGQPQQVTTAPALNTSGKKSTNF